MIIGNFIWGRISAVKQLQLIRKKEAEKLLRYCEKFRLDAVCEAELIKHSDEWENLLEAYIRRYATFTDENNILFVENSGRHPRLLEVFTEAFDSNGWCPSLLLMLLLLEKAEQVWETGETFKHFYGKISHRNSLIQEIANSGNFQMICRFLDFFPKPVYKNDYTIEIESRALWEQFFKTVSLASQKKYFSVSPKNLSEDLQDILQAYGKWDLINQLNLKHKQFKINSLSSFKFFVDYNRNNLDVLKIFLQHNDISKEFRQSLQDYRQWFAVNIYLDLFDNFVFTEPEAFCDFLGNCPEGRYKKYSVSVRAEAGLFKPENHKLLLDYASHDGRSWFKYRENRLRFVMMADIYPQQVEKYLQVNGRELLLSNAVFFCRKFVKRRKECCLKLRTGAFCWNTANKFSFGIMKMSIVF